MEFIPTSWRPSRQGDKTGMMAGRNNARDQARGGQGHGDVASGHARPDRYLSTRGGVVDATFDKVVLDGLAPDGGLYMPQAWPNLSHLAQRAADIPYASLCAEVLAPFAGDAIPREWINRATKEAAASFSHPDVVPLVPLKSGLFILELFHGPTLAFKDCAMQILAPLTRDLLRRRNERLLLLTATSGDTGAAAVRAFADAERVTLVVFHPAGRVSEAQRRQMTTCTAGNVHNFAVRGDFEDCQRLVKQLSVDANLLDGPHRVSTVNSINWCRLAGQIPYYLRAADLIDEAAHFVVPTGNLGDAFAGWVARRTGGKIASLTAAVNENDSLARALQDGTYTRRTAKPTPSVAMDCSAPSNFERLFFEASQRDADLTRDTFAQFSETGEVMLRSDVRKRAADEIRATKVTEEETRAQIAETYSETGRIVCPHTAVALAAAKRIESDGAPIVVLSTAHPAKFVDEVDAAIGKGLVEIPESLARLEGLPERLTSIDATIAAARKAVQQAFEAA